MVRLDQQTRKKTMKKLYPLKEIAFDRAWSIAGKLGKPAPYRGYALDLQNGQLLTHRLDGKFEVVSKPV